MPKEVESFLDDLSIARRCFLAMPANNVEPLRWPALLHG